MACDHGREIWNTENNKMKTDDEIKAADLLDFELKWDDNEFEDSKGQLHYLMAKCYQYTLVQHSVRYHHDTFTEKILNNIPIWDMVVLVWIHSPSVF